MILLTSVPSHDALDTNAWLALLLAHTITGVASRARLALTIKGGVRIFGACNATIATEAFRTGLAFVVTVTKFVFSLGDDGIPTFDVERRH